MIRNIIAIFFTTALVVLYTADLVPFEAVIISYCTTIVIMIDGLYRKDKKSVDHKTIDVDSGSGVWHFHMGSHHAYLDHVQVQKLVAHLERTLDKYQSDVG
jgi:hypothetical protein